MLICFKMKIKKKNNFFFHIRTLSSFAFIRRALIHLGRNPARFPLETCPVDRLLYRWESIVSPASYPRECYAVVKFVIDIYYMVSRGGLQN